MESGGRVQVITGAGKGKTTAALGLGLRAVGRGMKVFMVQFLKSPDSSGEHFAVETFGSKFTIKPMGRKGFIRDGGDDEQDSKLAEEAIDAAMTAMLSGEYDIVILDEINVAVHLGVVGIEEALEFIEARPESVELVFTGRYAHADLIDRADYVQEIRKIKHPFDEGVPARKGIEY